MVSAEYSRRTILKAAVGLAAVPFLANCGPDKGTSTSGEIPTQTVLSKDQQLLQQEQEASSILSMIVKPDMLSSLKLEHVTEKENPYTTSWNLLDKNKPSDDPRSAHVATISLDHDAQSKELSVVKMFGGLSPIIGDIERQQYGVAGLQHDRLSTQQAYTVLSQTINSFFILPSHIEYNYHLVESHGSQSVSITPTVSVDTDLPDKGHLELQAEIGGPFNYTFSRLSSK